ncbi:nonstructural protein [Peromfec virus RodF7_10]|uniref:Nonstructural protein n=1 Tax=Peromfec virus RodF7_10 TaxID=2929346 RepID=A0A976R7D5_9VIRU|nr:nonstructural protein [Peromfec virus RodF7_10]
MILTQENKALNEASSMSTFEIGVYTVYDTVLQQFDYPICLPINKVEDYFKLVVNDVTSKYYLKESDYILNKIGTFNQATGEIDLHFVERISVLDSYIDKPRRRYQTMLQVLNYLPHGYFKMPDEMKKTIQDKIDSATMEYVTNYVIPDLDVSNFDLDKVKDIYKNYDSLVEKLS